MKVCTINDVQNYKYENEEIFFTKNLKPHKSDQ